MRHINFKSVQIYWTPQSASDSSSSISSDLWKRESILHTAFKFAWIWEKNKTQSDWDDLMKNLLISPKPMEIGVSIVVS